MGFIIATLIVLVVIASVLGQDFSVFSWAYWQEGGTSTSRSEVFRNGGLFVAALFGLGFAFWRARIATRQAEAAAARADAAIEQARAANEQARAANEQARIAEQGQITDRFSTAVEHLGSKELPVRLGGIFALWRLAKDSPRRDTESVIDILCAFVRHPPHPLTDPPEPGLSTDGQAGGDEADSANKLRPDLQTILNLIADKKAEYRQHLPAGYCLDLVDANLTGAELWDADLTDADLAAADLADAELWQANLSGANLRGASLPRADLSGADLTDAKNLTQLQLDAIRFDRDDPPKLPPGLVLPEPPPEPKAEDAAPEPSES